MTQVTQINQNLRHLCLHLKSTNMSGHLHAFDTS